jgi:beta-glucanase (GH16 family)
MLFSYTPAYGGWRNARLAAYIFPSAEVRSFPMKLRFILPALLMYVSVSLAQTPSGTLTLDYEPSLQGLMLATGGPTDEGYAAAVKANPGSMFWQPRYIPQGADARGGTDIYSGSYQWNVDPAYSWSNHWSPFSIGADGFLHISAMASSAATPTFGSAELPVNPFTKAPYSYVSGLLSSKNAFSQQGGYFEVTGRFPTGYSMWPAFWLMPIRERHPPEIDIMESVGGYDSPGVYRATSIAISGPKQKVYGTGEDLQTAFHSYGVGWTDTVITEYFDGKVIHTEDISGLPEFQQPFYILLANQVGSNLYEWVPPPGVKTPVRSDIVISSVKAYQFAGPTSLNLSTSSYLDTDAEGSAVASISASNFDGASGYTFAKISDPDGVFTVSGSNLVLSKSVASTVQSSHQVTIRVTDSGGRTRTQIFTLGVVAGAPLQGNYVMQKNIEDPAGWGAINAFFPASSVFLEQPAIGSHGVYLKPVARNPGVQAYRVSANITPAYGRSEINIAVYDKTYGNLAQAIFNLSSVPGYVDYSGAIGFFVSQPFVVNMGGGVYKVGFTFTTDASSSGLTMNILSMPDQFTGSFPGVTADGLSADKIRIYRLGAAADGL